MSYIVMRKIPDSEDRGLTVDNSYNSFDIHSSGDWEAITRPLEDYQRALHMLELFKDTYRTGNKLYLFQVIDAIEVLT